MSPYDSDTTTVSNQADTELANAYQGADRLSKKYRFPLKIAAAYAAAILLGYAMHLTTSSQLTNTLSALLVYFTIMFAGITALIGVVFKLTAMFRTDR